MFTSNTLHQTVLTLIHPDRIAGEAVQDTVQTHALKHLNEQVGQLEAIIADRNPDWLSPRTPGALGYYLGILLRWAMYLPENKAMRFSPAPYPRLQAVLAAHEAFSAARRVAALDGLGPRPFTAPEGAMIE
jgi:glutathione S-transferase